LARAVDPARLKERVMGRRLYWQDSYGHVHRDRRAERARQGNSHSARRALYLLAALAVIVVMASALGH
jgi:hypothetical protein